MTTKIVAAKDPLVLELAAMLPPYTWSEETAVYSKHIHQDILRILSTLSLPELASNLADTDHRALMKLHEPLAVAACLVVMTHYNDKISRELQFNTQTLVSIHGLAVASVLFRDIPTKNLITVWSEGEQDVWVQLTMFPDSVCDDRLIAAAMEAIVPGKANANATAIAKRILFVTGHS